MRYIPARQIRSRDVRLIHGDTQAGMCYQLAVKSPQSSICLLGAPFRMIPSKIWEQRDRDRRGTQKEKRERNNTIKNVMNGCKIRTKCEFEKRYRHQLLPYKVNTFIVYRARGFSEHNNNLRVKAYSLTSFRDSFPTLVECIPHVSSTFRAFDTNLHNITNTLGCNRRPTKIKILPNRLFPVFRW